MKKNLRIVVSCVAFETVKIVEPIKYYRADRAYLVHMADRPVYKSFLKEVKKQIKALGIECEEVHTTIFEFSATLKELLRIIKEEKDAGNHVYVNVEAGPQVFGAAAIVACMMEGGIPFFVGTKKFWVDESAYFDGKTPVGLSVEVHDPKEVPTFKLDRPREEVVRALWIWNDRRLKGWSLTDNAVIEALERVGLMKGIYDEGGRRVSYNAKMNYRRKFLEKWIDLGWVEKLDRGRYDLTEFGEVAVEIFHMEL